MFHLFQKALKRARTVKTQTPDYAILILYSKGDCEMLYTSEIQNAIYYIEENLHRPADLQSFSEVGLNVPTTDFDPTEDLPDGPENLNFEE